MALVSAVLQEIIDESALDRTTTQMLPYFKSALRQMSAFIKDRVFLTEGTLSVAAAAQSASLSSLASGFTRERAVWYVSSGERIPIDPPPSIKFFQDIYTTVGTGKPSFYIIENTTIKFDKPLDAAITVGIDYFKEISSVALADTFLGDERVMQAAKHLTKSEYYGDYEEDEAKAARNERKGTAILMQLQNDYDAQEMGGNVEIKDDEGL